MEHHTSPCPPPPLLFLISLSPLLGYPLDPRFLSVSPIFFCFFIFLFHFHLLHPPPSPCRGGVRSSSLVAQVQAQSGFFWFWLSSSPLLFLIRHSLLSLFLNRHRFLFGGLSGDFVFLPGAAWCLSQIFSVQNTKIKHISSRGRSRSISTSSGSFDLLSVDQIDLRDQLARRPRHCQTRGHPSSRCRCRRAGHWRVRRRELARTGTWHASKGRRHNCSCLRT
jgi:hypothetical protein